MTSKSILKPPGRAILGILRQVVVPALVRVLQADGVGQEAVRHLNRLSDLLDLKDAEAAMGRPEPTWEEVRLQSADVTRSVAILDQILERLRTVGAGPVVGGADVVRAVAELHRATGYPIDASGLEEPLSRPRG